MDTYRMLLLLGVFLTLINFNFVNGYETGELRLVRGKCPTHGRVDIYFSGWGTILNNTFDDIAARIACQQLGYRYGLKALAPQGTGRAWLTSVKCRTSNKKIKDCSASRLRYSNSRTHTTDAGVQCYNDTRALDCDGQPYPSELQFNLTKRTCASSGVLTVFHDHAWRDMCSSSTRIGQLPALACPAVGYNGKGMMEASTPRSSNTYGGQYLIAVVCDNVTTVSNLSECQWTFSSSSSDCSTKGIKLNCYDENGVDCGGTTYPSEGDLRLDGGPCRSEGRLDIFHDGQWGSICNKGFSNDSAAVSCKQMGFETGMKKRYNSWRGSGMVWLTGVMCRGSCFPNLLACEHAAWGNSAGCSHSYDVALQCYNYTGFRDCSGRPLAFEGALALVSGKTPNSGRLEIYHSGRWGTICDDSFGTAGAKVACHQLGYHTGSMGGSSTAPSGSGTTWLDDVICSSYHTTISECRHRSWGLDDCGHDEDVRLICTYDKECESNPCQNNGTCQDGFNAYSCSCAKGFTGSECRTNINECSVYNGPCDNGGTCIDGDADYTCLCMGGYENKNCSIETDECASNPCQHNGTCTDKLNAFICTCAPGYIDTNCETEINECLLLPCHNGGTCRDNVNSFTCDCQTGYTGSRCDSNVDECASSPCQNNGTCLDGNNWYFCKCIPGYHGHHCEISSFVNECLSSPCKNNGSCIDGDNWYVCKCPEGYSGHDCQISPFTDECSSNPCQNGGTCFDGNGWYVCKCLQSFSGHDCQIPADQDECASNPCQNGGRCLDGNAWYVCQCPPAFHGHDCQLAQGADQCGSAPCRNNGTCLSGDDWYVCKCPQGYNGANCETIQREDECASRPCLNNGTCYDGDGWFICKCPLGYAGDTCQHQRDVNQCASNPCRNGGTCMDGKNWFVCKCNPGYTGDLCQIAPKPGVCLSNPCQNGGRCLGGADWYTCRCTDSYRGDNCQLVKDPDRCHSNPCQNNATCYGGEKWYMCTCTQGFSGTQCELQDNPDVTSECDSNPCMNGGTCLEGKSWYVCKCADSFQGHRCQTPKGLNVCDSAPCQNGGTCRSGDDWYMCVCRQSFSGHDCQIPAAAKVCASNPCANGGQCMDGGTWYTCKCTDGFIGPNCVGKEADPCTSNPCQNNGTCLAANTWYHCKCIPNYSGDNCQVAPAPAQPEANTSPQASTNRMGMVTLWILVAVVSLIVLILATYLIIRWRRRRYLSMGKPVHMHHVGMELSVDTDVDDFTSMRE